MDFYARHAASLKALEAWLGEKCPRFTWNDQEFPILPGSVHRNKDLGPGGFKLRADLRFVVVVSDLPTPGPALKQTIIYMGEHLRIDGIETFAGGRLMRVECNDAAQGA